MTLNPAMGEFLNMDTSTKYDPNENYAREIMQLFSIGTELLNQDGTTQNDASTGRRCPRYDQSVIDKFKRVYTGWYIDQVPVPAAQRRGDTCDDCVNPMIAATRTTTTPTRRRSSSASCRTERRPRRP